VNSGQDLHTLIYIINWLPTQIGCASFAFVKEKKYPDWGRKSLLTPLTSYGGC